MEREPKSFKFSIPAKPEELEEAYKNGMLRIEELKDRTFYFGDCRNASIAMWVKELNMFLYQREKFGSRFLEDIHHPANDNGFDIFIPEQECEPSVCLKLYFEKELEPWLKWRKELCKRNQSF